MKKGEIRVSQVLHVDIFLLGIKVICVVILIDWQT